MLFLRVNADGFRVADRAKNLSTWAPDAISAGGGAVGGAPFCTPPTRLDFAGGGRVAMASPLENHPNHRGGGDSGGASGLGRLGTVQVPPAGTGSATRTARRTPTSRGRRHAPVAGTVIFPL